MKTSYIEYAMSVIVGRALPDVRDGLKPVHRRILYAMYEGPDLRQALQEIRHLRGRRARPYHPHGDASVYDAMVRLAQDFSMRYMLVDGHGNFGSVDGDPPAAYRYTEAADQDRQRNAARHRQGHGRLGPQLRRDARSRACCPRVPQPAGQRLLRHRRRHGDQHPAAQPDRGHQRLHLRARQPGRHPRRPDAARHGPGLPDRGIIMGRSGIRAAYATGRGRRSCAPAPNRESARDRQRIIVTELPYMVNKRQLIKKIAEQVNDKRLEGISDLRDESDRNGMRIVIELKKDANARWCSTTSISPDAAADHFRINMLALVDNQKQPKILSLRQILDALPRPPGGRRHPPHPLRPAQGPRARPYARGLLIAQDNIDEVIHIIRSSRRREGSGRLIERFGLTTCRRRPSRYALRRLRAWSATSWRKSGRAGRGSPYQELLANGEDPGRHQGGDARDPGQVRRQAPHRDHDVEDDIDIEDLIAEEDMVVTITHTGYIKRIPWLPTAAQKRGGKGVSGVNLKEEDVVDEMFIAPRTTTSCSSRARARSTASRCYEIPEGYAPGARHRDRQPAAP